MADPEPKPSHIKTIAGVSAAVIALGTGIVGAFFAGRAYEAQRPNLAVMGIGDSPVTYHYIYPCGGRLESDARTRFVLANNGGQTAALLDIQYSDGRTIDSQRVEEWASGVGDADETWTDLAVPRNIETGAEAIDVRALLTLYTDDYSDANMVPRAPKVTWTFTFSNGDVVTYEEGWGAVEMPCL